MVIVAAAILVSASCAVIYRDVLEDAFPLWGPRSTEWIMKTDPNLKVRGIIEEIKLNHRRDGFTSYHRFPAVILLNETETLGQVYLLCGKTFGFRELFDVLEQVVRKDSVK